MGNRQQEICGAGYLCWFMGMGEDTQTLHILGIGHRRWVYEGRDLG
ncbi:MAG: hypothetical protein ACKO57_00600 [Alphaproteobacteria bacterium]